MTNPDLSNEPVGGAPRSITEAQISSLGTFFAGGQMTETKLKPLNFEELRRANFERQKEWDSENKITLEYRGNELGGEVGELQNLIKKLARERLGLRGTRATKEQIAEELGDVIICTDLLAFMLNVDLGRATQEKFNKTSEKYGLKERMFLDSHSEPQKDVLVEVEREAGDIKSEISEQDEFESLAGRFFDEEDMGRIRYDRDGNEYICELILRRKHKEK